MYQFFALHALHQSLEEMDGFTLAEVEGFLDGGDDISLNPVREPSVEKHKCTFQVFSKARTFCTSILMKAAGLSLAETLGTHRDSLGLSSLQVATEVKGTRG